MSAKIVPEEYRADYDPAVQQDETKKELVRSFKEITSSPEARKKLEIASADDPLTMQRHGSSGLLPNITDDKTKAKAAL